MSVAPVCVVCWSAKGGSGTSVVAAALALKSADCGRETLLVDLDGDQPDVLGVSPGGLGVTDWLAAGDDVPVDALAGMEVPVIGRLRLLPRGEEAAASNDRLRLLAGILSTGSRTIVIDAGTRRREAGKLAEAALSMETPGAGEFFFAVPGLCFLTTGCTFCAGCAFCTDCTF